MLDSVEKQEKTTKSAMNLRSFLRDELSLSLEESIEAIQKMRNEESDFSIDDWRFIANDAIDQIQQDELSSDEYVLGCFNASFLAGVTDLPIEMIEACQSAEQYEAIGKAIIDGCWLEDVQREYARADGYGHHFSGYDFSEREIGAYYVFRN